MVSALSISEAGVFSVPVCGYLPDAHRAWREMEHSNPHYQLVLARGPALRFRRQERRATLCEGQFHILLPHEVHQAWGDADPGSGFYFAQFRVDPAPEHLPDPDRGSRPDHMAVPCFGEVEHFDLTPRFELLVAEWTQRPPFYQARAAAILHEMLVILARHGRALDGQAQPVRPASPRGAEIVHRVKGYIQAHYQERITAHEISAALHLHYSYIARLFHKATGLTIRSYLHTVRLRQARKLLVEVNAYKTIAQVAAAVGYADPYYFSRLFRRWEGMSPRQFVAASYGRSPGEPSQKRPSLHRPYPL